MSRKKRPTPDALVYERDLQQTIQQAASLFGWRCYHTYDSRRSPEGFPDLVIAGHGMLLMWELKSTEGALTDAQGAWLETLSEVTGPPLVEVIRPADLDRCLAVLKGKGNS